MESKIRHVFFRGGTLGKVTGKEVATIPSKRLRNKIAGFTTHLMKRHLVEMMGGEEWWKGDDGGDDVFFFGED